MQRHGLRRFRHAAYTLVVAFALLRLPARARFALQPPTCDLSLDTAHLAASLAKLPHLILFAVFCLLTILQFDRIDRRAFAWSVAATLALGAYVELMETMTRRGNRRLADLLPDLAGALAACALVAGAVAMREYWVRRAPR